jgi:ubiquinone/menaquinone biosynthesis C-methylase UbiE
VPRFTGTKTACVILESDWFECAKSGFFVLLLESRAHWSIYQYAKESCLFLPGLRCAVEISCLGGLRKDMQIPNEFKTWREDRYRDILSSNGKNALLVRIWREAYGVEYPEDADPFGFVTVSDLDSISSGLRIGAGAPLVDVGCGRGGPGLWVARKTGCRLTGLDIVGEAIEHAGHLRERMGMTRIATFCVGSFSSTGLNSRSQSGAMSVDAFWMVLDKPAALREMARILIPGARLVMTTWVGGEAEFERMLRAAGFRLLSCAETPGWRERQMAVYRGILRNRVSLEQQMGSAAAVLLEEAREAPARLAVTRRCLLVAELRA